jgi:hypothetical protein
VQLGWNAGPMHARVYGLAKSYSKHVDPDTMIDRDSDAIASLTIMWGLIKSLIPEEVVSEVNQCLDNEGMPRMATRNIEPGMYYSCACSRSNCYYYLGSGYQFTIGGKTYSFPLVERAPPEGYMSQDYVT